LLSHVLFGKPVSTFPGHALDEVAFRKASQMWYGYAMEAIYTILGTVLVVVIVGILVYQ
jgi:hypothetical protein